MRGLNIEHGLGFGNKFRFRQDLAKTNLVDAFYPGGIKARRARLLSAEFIYPQYSFKDLDEGRSFDTSVLAPLKGKVVTIYTGWQAGKDRDHFTVKSGKTTVDVPMGVRVMASRWPFGLRREAYTLTSISTGL